MSALIASALHFFVRFLSCSRERREKEDRQAGDIVPPPISVLCECKPCPLPVETKAWVLCVCVCVLQ